jgi:hypothetical protein
MLHTARLPKIYWIYAYMTAAYIHNRLPNKRMSTSPLKVLYKIPALPITRYPFGARAIITLHKGNHNKLDECGVKCYLLGYPKAGAGWMFYSPKLKRMMQNTLAIFPDFQKLKVKRELRKNDVGFLVNQIKLVLGGEPTAELAAEELKAIVGLPGGPEHNLPKNIKQALAGPDGREWSDAARYELDKFHNLDVWEPVNPYKGVKVLGACWVLTIKRLPDVSVDKFCARYIAKGFNQTLGVDCNETYAPTASLNTLRLLISVTRQHHYPTASFDISSAYLYSPIKEEVYVQPPVELNPHWKGKIMKLKKAPVFSPKNPPEDPLTDAISQGPQGVNSGGLGNI